LVARGRDRATEGRPFSDWKYARMPPGTKFETIVRKADE